MRLAKNSSFITALQLAEYPKIYFLKEQKPQFTKILRELTEHFTQEGMTLDDAYACISEDNQFDTVRVEEPDLFQFRSLPLLQLIMPTFGKKTLIRTSQSLGLDRVKRPELSLNQYLTVKDSDVTNHRLKLLKKRNCRFSHERLKTILNERKKKTAMNQMVFFDKYNDLLVFECKHLKIIVKVILAVLDHNRKVSYQDDQQLLCFFEPLLRKVAAVTQF